MERKCLFIAILIFCGFNISAQSNLFYTQEIRQAFENEYRSKDGNPGINYFQNQSNYEIEVELIPETGIVSGVETIEYFNNSTINLRNIVVRFYQDYYKKGAERNMECSPEDLHDGVKVKSISAVIDGETIEITENNIMGTSRFYGLSKPITAGNSVEIVVEWEFSMPKYPVNRYGTYDESTFFVAYWYPQVAVFDDVYHWYYQSFFGSQEFYNDFGNFDVKIKVPGDQVVWATGILQNSEQLFKEKYLKRIEAAKMSDEIVKIIAEDDLKEQITKTADYHIWHFKAENVTDFAFATSNHCLWDATSVPSIKGSKERVFVSSVYQKGAIDFDKVAEIAQKTIDIISNEVLGVEFPFPKMTVFSGGPSGMEFPMMVNDQEFDKYETTVFATAHEVSHTYFPFYVGTNEHKTAWLDEGLVTFLPKYVESQILGNDDALIGMVKGFSMYAARSFEVPLMNPSYALSGYSYTFQAYSRSANAFFALKQLIGDDLFKTVMQEFIARWHGKHPTGYDFFYTVEDVTKMDLKWFWEPWFFEFGYADLAITDAKFEKNVLTVTIDKFGNLPVTVSLKVFYEDGTNDAFEYSSEVWKDSDKLVVKEKVSKKVVSVELGNEYIPDTYPDNNKFEMVAK
ncbi:MAG: M1 family metallopeptidase [Bacteroidales bacterium]|nr:M1 family metallopeptidase [Bacteroidales bacterium]